MKLEDCIFLAGHASTNLGVSVGLGPAHQNVRYCKIIEMITRD